VDCAIDADTAAFDGGSRGTIGPRSQPQVHLQGRKPNSFLWPFFGTAEQLGEKGQIFARMPKNMPQGLKPEHYFCGIYGTTEVVPFRTLRQKSSFSPSCKVMP
jgi:hypothetical protein